MTRVVAAMGCATALSLVAVALSSAGTIYVEVGTVRTTFGASFKPSVLPKSKRAPIAIRLSSRIQGRGGEHIPAIARAKIGIDRSLTIDARGVPVCAAGQLENQTSEGAEAACAAAIVGSGSASIEIVLGGQPVEAYSRLLAFNGGIAGTTTTIFVHAYLSTPVPQALVVPVTLTKVSKGGYGMQARAAIPKIAEGSGSLSRFDLTLRRQVATVGGKLHGYLLGKCADGNFVFEPEVEFADGDLARGLLAQGCRTGS